MHLAGRETRVLADQIRTIDTHYVVGDPVDHLSAEDMAQVEFAVGRLLGLRLDLGF